MTPAFRRGRPDKTTQATTNGRSLSLDISQLPASRFPLPASRFPLPASSFRLPASSFQRSGVRASNAVAALLLVFGLAGRTPRLRHTHTIPLPFLSFLLRKIVMQREGEQRPTV